MPTTTLTDVLVRSIRPTPGKRVEYVDAKVPGLALRVMPSGEKSWALRYRRIDQKQRRFTFGSYPTISLATARERALKVLSEVAAGQDPATEKKSEQERARAERLNSIGGIGEAYFADAEKGRHK